MAISIKEIAKIAKVSIATVSRVINNDPKVKVETRAKIQEIIKKYDYQPNLLAKSFVMGKTFTIGLIMPDIIDEYFTEIIKGVDEIAFNRNYNLLVSSTHGDRTLKESLKNFAKGGLLDGFIIMAPSINEQIKNYLNTLKIPIVLINAKKELENRDTVSIDNYGGSYNMTKLLIEKGYKRIAHITGPINNNDALERYRGYEKALIDAGMNIDDKLIIKSDFTINGGYVACEKLLKMKKKPDVIFAANDMMAIGCYNYLQANDIKIPDEISVVGFDNIFISEYLTPKLTTVDTPIIDIGRTAAKLLFERIEDPEKKYERIKIPTQIKYRQSTK